MGWARAFRKKHKLAHRRITRKKNLSEKKEVWRMRRFHGALRKKALGHHKKEKSFEETLCDTANTALRENAVIKTEGTLQSEPSFH